MNERRFDLAVTSTFLVLGVAYLVVMASYPSRAGLVPAIVAGVFCGALSIDLVRGIRGRVSAPTAAPVEVDDTPVGGSHATHGAHDGDGASDVDEVDGYDALVRLDRSRRNRLLLIVAWTILYLIGSVLIGFVVTTGVLLVALFLVLRESPRATALMGTGGVVAAYLLVVVLLDLPVLDGWLVERLGG